MCKSVLYKSYNFWFMQTKRKINIVVSISMKYNILLHINKSFVNSYKSFTEIIIQIFFIKTENKVVILIKILQL